MAHNGRALLFLWREETATGRWLGWGTCTLYATGTGGRHTVTGAAAGVPRWYGGRTERRSCQYIYVVWLCPQLVVEGWLPAQLRRRRAEELPRYGLQDIMRNKLSHTRRQHRLRICADVWEYNRRRKYWRDVPISCAMQQTDNRRAWQWRRTAYAGAETCGAFLFGAHPRWLYVP